MIAQKQSFSRLIHRSRSQSTGNRSGSSSLLLSVDLHHSFKHLIWNLKLKWFIFGLFLKASKIQISSPTQQLLDPCGEYIFESRGKLSIKVSIFVCIRHDLLPQLGVISHFFPKWASDSFLVKKFKSLRKFKVKAIEKLRNFEVAWTFLKRWFLLVEFVITESEIGWRMAG